MAYTVNDLIESTLQELGVLDTGQPVEAEEATALQKRLPSLLADLNARDVGFIDITNIEDGEFIPLSQILAYSSYNIFSVTDVTKIAALTAIGGKGGEAEQTIKNLKRLRTPRQTMRVESFTRRRYGRTMR